MTLRSLALLPLLVAQGLFVAARATRLPEPPGPREGRIGAGPPLSLLILGDSSAAGVGASTQDKALAGQLTTALARDFTVHWRLTARSGATTRSTLSEMARAPVFPCDVAVVALGVNDVKNGMPLAKWRQSYAALLVRLTKENNTQHIIACGVPPMGAFPLLPNPLRRTLGNRAAQFDRALQEICAQTPEAHHLAFDLPMTEDLVAQDGFHPSEQLYALWAVILAQHIKAGVQARSTRTEPTE
ncbi:SGNH/GDSL hydrolase family protein [Primorskyibacter sp. S187A]|uniref:SGNH/GDSL hydrolase family protein n=1 Tax=Primorskyibacter sp. S187A TaxID=3415130 RepID=UPI003C7A3B95